ncbi:hypothetical protein O3P69_017545 [Scylla paramamosain]|uniref:Uncharacterized protein n=1 Tax=Scylla paramamosain TaxID=85552 RepID=A0AAW0TW81_SCYPA
MFYKVLDSPPLSRLPSLIALSSPTPRVSPPIPYQIPPQLPSPFIPPPFLLYLTSSKHLSKLYQAISPLPYLTIQSTPAPYQVYPVSPLPHSPHAPVRYQKGRRCGVFRQRRRCVC